MINKDGVINRGGGEMFGFAGKYEMRCKTVKTVDECVDMMIWHLKICEEDGCPAFIDRVMNGVVRMWKAAEGYKPLMW